LYSKKGKFVEDLNICFSLLSYLEGENASDLLPQYSRQEQYHIGLEALAMINSLRAPTTMTPWYERTIKKHRKYLNEYKT
jgi:hypothetical protein